MRILVDPWLTGKLVFPPGEWLICGKLNSDIPVPERIDLILLTQGLADHAHIPTLKILNKSIPVIGSLSATKVVQNIGFSNCQYLNPGMKTTLKSVIIEATAGAPVPNNENGYIINHSEGSLYIEPHGFLDENLSTRYLDAVITPIIDLNLPLTGAFIKGKSILPELIKKFSPLTILASTTGGDASFTGIINRFIETKGTVEEAMELTAGDIKLINSQQKIEYKIDTR